MTDPIANEQIAPKFQNQPDSSSSTNSLLSDGENDALLCLQERYGHQQQPTPSCGDKNTAHSLASPSSKRRDSRFARPPPSPSNILTAGQLHQPPVTSTCQHRDGYSHHHHHQSRSRDVEEPDIDPSHSPQLESTPTSPKNRSQPQSKQPLQYRPAPFVEAIIDQSSDKWSPTVKTPTTTSLNSIQGTISSTASSKCKKTKDSDQTERNTKPGVVLGGDTGKSSGTKKTLECKHRVSRSNDRCMHITNGSPMPKTSSRFNEETTPQSIEQAPTGRGSERDKETGAGDGGLLQEEVEALRKEVIEHRWYLFYSNKEAQFYYKKLREIEDLCNRLKKIEPKPHTTILKLFFEIIHETEVFSIVCIGLTSRCKDETLLRFLLTTSIGFSLGNVVILILYGYARCRPLPNRYIGKLSEIIYQFLASIIFAVAIVVSHMNAQKFLGNIGPVTIFTTFSFGCYLFGSLVALTEFVFSNRKDNDFADHETQTAEDESTEQPVVANTDSK